MVDKIGSNPSLAAQQTQNTTAVGSLGDRSVRRGRSPFAAVKNALSRAFHYVSVKFKSLFSRRVQVGGTRAGQTAATPQTPPGQRGAPLALGKAGTWNSDVKGLETMFRYDKLTESGITEQMAKDIPRSDYIIHGEDTQRDPGRTEQSLCDLVKDENGSVDEKMLLAVSQIAHQGMLAEGENNLIMDLLTEHGVTPAAKKGGSGDSRYELQRLDNGDIRINGSSRTDVRSLVGPDGKSEIELKEDSFYEYSFSVTINAESVAKGQPTLTATPVQYAYNLVE